MAFTQALIQTPDYRWAIPHTPTSPQRFGVLFSPVPIGGDRAGSGAYFVSIFLPFKIFSFDDYR